VTPTQLAEGRKAAMMTQVLAAQKLGVSQPYLSQLERGVRPVPAQLAYKAYRVFRMPPTALPLNSARVTPALSLHGHPAQLARDLAALGYPGFSHVRGGRKVNPAALVLDVLSHDDVDVRLVEALPWVLFTFPDMDWEWLLREVKVRNLQNRLGFVVSLARSLAKDVSGTDRTLGQVEQELERARLVHEDTLCNVSIPKAERSWVRDNRTDAARHWNLLTGLSPEHLAYTKKPLTAFSYATP
jgi:transcriptional regulator with XRE-family HTH domain